MDLDITNYHTTVTPDSFQATFEVDLSQNKLVAHPHWIEGIEIYQWTLFTRVAGHPTYSSWGLISQEMLQDRQALKEWLQTEARANIDRIAVAKP